MITFASLKLSATVKPTSVPTIQVRRNKLAKRLWEQTELAKARQAGTQFTTVRFRTIADKETGLRKQVETSKLVKQWWFTSDNGKVMISVRYGARLLELAKGKFAIELASEKDLVPTLDAIKTAVLNGELDSAIDAAANKLREGFAGA
jgi:hypothetical protein